MLKYIIIGVICCLALETNATTVLLSDYKAPKNEEFKAFQRALSNRGDGRASHV